MSDNPIIDAWNSGDAANLAPLYADDAERHHYALPETRLDGKDAIVAGIGAILHAIPDAVLTVRSREGVADGRILLEWTFAGTLENDYGPLPGNGSRITLNGVSVIAFTPGGLIQREDVYWDSATLMAAAGVLPVAV
jgi:steroid delta-isomerase-like uncharacterized protein